MRTLTFLCLLLTTTSILYSCKKNGKSANEGTQLERIEAGVPSNMWYRTLVRNSSDKLVSFRDSGTTGAQETVTFEYGSNGNISRANIIGNQGNILYYYEFEYNGNGTLRKKLAVPGTLNIADDYDIYAYDANGRIIADSVFQKSGLPPTYKLSELATYSYTGNNITECLQYHFYTGSQVLAQRRKFEYDNGNNPFNPYAQYYSFSSGADISLALYASKNNIVKEFSADGNDPYQLVQSLSYKYNSSNYPWKMKTEMATGATSTSETEYFYKQ